MKKAGCVLFVAAVLTVGLHAQQPTAADLVRQIQGLLTQLQLLLNPTVTVTLIPAGGNLQAAIDAAQPGDTLKLAAGATYTGNFILRAKTGSGVITITSDLALPSGRVSPISAVQFAKLISPNSTAALATEPGAHHYALVGLEIATVDANDTILLGDGSKAQNTLAMVPHDLVLDRLYVHGDSVKGTKRGIALNSASTAIRNSYVSDIKRVGQDTQAIGGCCGPGPYVIDNNYLEASAENVLFGGSDPGIPNLVPSDILITNNLIAKPLAWKGSTWQVKNLLELKNARRVVIRGNTLEYNWSAAQPGWSVVLTPRNQDGGCPWCQVDDVLFEQNIVGHVAMGFNILGTDNLQPSLQTQKIIIRNNLLYDVDFITYGGSGYAFLIDAGPKDVTIDHNTIDARGWGLMQLGGAPIVGFTFTNNIAKHNDYGIIGSGHGVGNDSLLAFAPGAIVTGNVIAGAVASRYPPGNLYPPVTDFPLQFVDLAGGNYHLLPTSTWAGAGRVWP
jgi:Right handed beta helix region